MKKLIAIDNGHGRHTAGKRTPPFEDGGFFNEWEFNYPTAKKLGELLKYNGFEIIYVSNTDEDTPLKNRAKIANNANADILVSIHYNAYKGIWGDHGGIETYHYPTSLEGKKLADTVQKYLIGETGLVDRKVQSANFQILRETNMPAILCECGFMDSLAEAKLMKDETHQWDCAIAIVKGICEYFGVEYTDRYKVYNIQIDPYLTMENTLKALGLLKKAGFHGVVHKKTVGKPIVEDVEEMLNLEMLEYEKLVKNGSKGDYVKKLQLALNQLGYDVGNADGIAGTKTIEGIKKLQESNNLTVDGIAGQDTYKVINKLLNNGTEEVITPPIEVVPKNYLEYKITIKNGSRGEEVKELQKVLNSLGYNVGAEDGIAGNNTIIGIRRFQIDYNLTVDGIAGKNTYNMLNQALNGKKPIVNTNYIINRPDTQTTIVKIPHTQIKFIDVILANTTTNRETLSSMQNRTGVDFIINGGLYWTDTKNRSYSLNLLIDEGVQNNAGIYSRFGLMIYQNNKYKFDWYKWTSDLKDMMGGSPSLIINGKIDIDIVGMDSALITARHPRTALGMCNNYFYLVAIDGRRAGQKMYGMTINELANFMLGIGCNNAINLDGGGSTRLLHNGTILNKPFENRAIHNAIGIRLV